MIQRDKSAQLLTAKDKPAFSVIHPNQVDTPILLLCDHASNDVPLKLNGLDIDQAYFERHIAYDIGAADLTIQLAQRLHATAVLAGFSRLVMDANRFLSADTAMPELSDGVEIRGNLALSKSDALLRIEELFVPYHHAIAQQAARISALFSSPLIVAIHSFTPVFKGFERPWDIGIVWEGKNEIAKELIQYLRDNTDYSIGDNEPYHACDPLGYTMRTHAQSKGIPNLMFEVRQDLVTTAAGQRHFSKVLAQAITAIEQSANFQIGKRS